MTAEPRKRPVKSPYLFPSYPFSTAVALASKVAVDGGGSLSEATLAIALGISAKSSGFRLKVLATRQFGLLIKRGGMLSVTPLGGAITKPANQAGEHQAKIDSFLQVPLFKALALRFRGQPLPPNRMLRHILEQEFRLESNRVSEAERIFEDSAREAGLLRSSGGKTYLDTEAAPGNSAQIMEGFEPSGGLKMNVRPTSILGGSVLSISEDDLSVLSDTEYAAMWQALGKIIRARAKKLQAADNSSPA